MDNLTHSALSICYIPEEGWALVEIKYDPKTGETGPVVKSYEKEGKDYIMERFKIETINRQIFNNSGVAY